MFLQEIRSSASLWTHSMQKTQLSFDNVMLSLTVDYKCVLWTCVMWLSSKIHLTTCIAKVTSCEKFNESE